MQIQFRKYSQYGAGGPGGPPRSLGNMLIIKWLILTAAVFVADALIDGIRISGFASAFFGAGAIGVLNLLVKPVLFILTLPLTLLTFGLFAFVINALVLKMASGLIPGFSVVGFWSAIFGSIIISITNWLLTRFFSDISTPTPGKKDSGTIELEKKDDHWE